MILSPVNLIVGWKNLRTCVSSFSVSVCLVFENSTQFCGSKKFPEEAGFIRNICILLGL